MSILEANVASGAFPQYSMKLAADIELLTAMVAYQKNPGTETYNKVQKVLFSIQDQFNSILCKLNGTYCFLSILDSDGKLIWYTGPKTLEKYASLIYADLEYSLKGQVMGSVYKQFEDGFILQGDWTGGFPTQTGGKPSFTFSLYTSPVLSIC
jgi:hypothetical protein